MVALGVPGHAQQSPFPLVSHTNPLVSTARSGPAECFFPPVLVDIDTIEVTPLA